MPRNLHFLTNKELGLIIILFQELFQATFGNGKGNECSMQSKETLTYQTLALIHNNPLMML
jgi:hypothetical protein